jgi:hypothetical protein
LKPLRYGKRWFHNPETLSMRSSKAEALHQRLIAAAERLGVFKREAEMRRALHDGRYGDAARLRGENLAVMRGAVARSSA